jgi:hypothetical protein
MSYPLRRSHFTDTTARPLAPHPQHRTRPLRSRTLALGLSPSRGRNSGRTIDLDEITTPQILNPRQIQGLHSGLRSWNCPRGLVKRHPASLTLLYYEGFCDRSARQANSTPLVTAADLTAIKRQGDGVRVGAVDVRGDQPPRVAGSLLIDRLPILSRCARNKGTGNAHHHDKSARGRFCRTDRRDAHLAASSRMAAASRKRGCQVRI